ncbi:transcriptional regulator, IclR family [Alteribacillus persepolensis]|uniref:Transcriptional regulator, IclR family n=1 Tax=Alteribacillus persepolensis TaxID=568899 RepID=A0A1G8A8Q3_9BACI|nr:IclR family transcriptional regulator [Alteribacillus persepolensis]SDH17334.1 transcriptional regulator, IclR family [Alteribacillus persepolensis]
MAEKKNTQVQSLLVGFSIIDLMVERGIPMKFNDIHHETKITKSNLYKYLHTLTSLGILHRDDNTGMYTLGSTLIQYGMAAVNKEDVVTKTNSFLQQINLKTKETTLLTVWTQSGPMITKMIHSSLGLNLGGQVGSILPIQSAAGKLFAAFMNNPMIEAWKNDQQANWDKKDRQWLDEELDIIQEQKISFAKEALASSISSVAIPIFNYNDDIIGSIIVVGFADAIPQSTDHELSLYLLEKSKEVSSVFGGKL